MRVLGLIPARGGSKGVPRKNIKLLNGKPLLAYTAECALASKKLTKIVLSTDDQEIAEVGAKCGIDVPFMRPSELATDTTPSIQVVRHALAYFEEKGENYDAVCLLQPTNPLRRAEDVDQCLDILELTQADGVISVLRVPLEYNPHWIYRQQKNGALALFSGESEPVSRRQDLPDFYHRDGSVYAVRCSVVMNLNSLYGRNVQGYLMNPAHSANIDTVDDWLRVAARMPRAYEKQA